MHHKYLGDFIDGRFLISERPDGSWSNLSPANLKETTLELSFRNDHVDEACGAAKKAFREWCHLKLQDRSGSV